MRIGSAPQVFTFVAQSGELESKAALLAASLRSQIGDSARLIAAVPFPQASWGRLSSVAERLFRELGVEIVPIESPFGPRYAIGNKISALSTGGDNPSVLLDSDILCLNSPRTSPLTDVFQIAAKPEDVPSYDPGEKLWSDLYTRHGLALDHRRVLTTVTGKLTVPYFNSGVVFVSNAGTFSESWLSVARSLDQDVSLTNKYPWLDQIALPIAARKLGWAFRPLTEKWNYPVRSKIIGGEPDPKIIFAHYGHPMTLMREPVLVRRVLDLIKRFPPLRPVLELDPGWALLLADSAERLARSVPSSRNFLITGIPRSGTSLLCRLLHDQKDVVAINEPRQLTAISASDEYGAALRRMFADIRREIILGRPIENKLSDGKVITDTAVENAYTFYRPTISSEQFVFGVKSTLECLTRLLAIHRAFPALRIFACIRHPVATISSWKRTFPHLAKADLTGLGASELVHLMRLGEIRSVSDVRVRRALLWRHLAQLTYDYSEFATTVKYEDVTRDANVVIQQIMCEFDGKDATKRSITCQIIAGQDPLNIDPEEERIIGDICGPIAEMFGYSL